jgi:hypothetical protein
MTTSRINIPIPPNEPEPESDAQQDLAFEFVEGKNGLLEFKAESTEAHIVAFRKVNEGIDDHFWTQGAIVASLTKKHGEKGAEIDELAKAVDLSSGYLRQMARTWRTFNFISRDTSLNFSIHKAACRHPNPAEALAVCKAQGWSHHELQRWISDQAIRRADKATRKARSAARNDWRQHLMHMDEVIVKDFIALSPNKEFARRVCGGWREEIADELKQLEFSDQREIVINAIDERGAEDAKAIRKMTGIDGNTIDNIIAVLLSENLFEWVPKGGKKDDQRGTASMYLHRVGTPIGT